MDRVHSDYASEDLCYHHSTTEAPDKNNFVMHAHDKYEIYYFISGSASYLVEGTEYELRAHDIIIMRRSETHRLLVSDENVPYERVVVNFSPVLPELDLTPLLAPFESRPLGKMNRIAKEDFRDGLYQSLFANMCAGPPDKAAERLSAVASLVLILTQINRAFGRIEGPQGDGGREEALIAYVNSRLFDDISLSGISETFYLSKTQINRMFRKMTGSTLWNYVRIKRLLAAREEIRSGVHPNDAAKKCGYSDYSAFYRAYVSRFGVCPRDDG